MGVSLLAVVYAGYLACKLLGKFSCPWLPSCHRNTGVIDLGQLYLSSRGSNSGPHACLTHWSTFSAHWSTFPAALWIFNTPFQLSNSRCHIDANLFCHGRWSVYLGRIVATEWFLLPLTTLHCHPSLCLASLCLGTSLHPSPPPTTFFPPCRQCSVLFL